MYLMVRPSEIEASSGLVVRTHNDSSRMQIDQSDLVQVLCVFRFYPSIARRFRIYSPKTSSSGAAFIKDGMG